MAWSRYAEPFSTGAERRRIEDARETLLVYTEGNMYISKIHCMLNK